MLALTALVLCLTPTVVDGDTFKCANLSTSVRMSGLDTPEMPGHCRVGRVCVPGDPFAARDNLKALLASGPVKIRVLKKDLYQRNVAVAYVGPLDLSCAQIAGKFGIYKPTWDTRHLVKKDCKL